MEIKGITTNERTAMGTHYTAQVSDDQQVTIYAHVLFDNARTVTFGFGNDEMTIIMNGENARAQLIDVLTNALAKVVNAQ